MIAALLERASATLGRSGAVAAVIAAVVGALALVVALVGGYAAPALAALTASWLFFAGCAAGGLAFGAAVRVTGGRWAAAVLPVADASAGFFVPALALLLVIVLGAGAFVPWVAEAHHISVFLVVRQVGASAILFTAGDVFLRGVHRGDASARVARAGAVYLFLYAVVLSGWAYDLVIQLYEGPAITALPAFYFVGAFLSGVAWVGLLTALRRGDDADTRHDVGKLLFGLLVLWTYLLWSIFLPTWYGNVPEESLALLLRWRLPWRPIAIAVLVLVFLGPFSVLFTEPLKRRRATFVIGAGAVVVGLAAERFLLVLPSLDLHRSAAGIAAGALVAIGVLGVFLLAIGRRLGPY